MEGRIAKTAAALLSTTIAVVAAEAIAAHVHDDAFGFLNLFVADARYGVTLRPRATARVRSRHGRVTEITTNEAGFRGPEWVRRANAAPLQNRVLVLGDSQVMGFGVELSDSLSARLADSPRAGAARLEVLPAAVPSWGPHESVLALEELGPIYRPAVALFVANVANDWTEARTANRRRTTALDGWAIRYDPRRPAPVQFPGRDLLFGRSHLFHAARRLLSRVSPDASPTSRAEMAASLLSELPRLSRPERGHRSRITPFLLSARATCRRLGCRLIVVTLPLDVQVHPGEWAKYGTWARSTIATERLSADLLADARDAGIDGLDLLPALRRASPGAFLPDDYHLSPRGHRAAARAIAEVLP